VAALDLTIEHGLALWERREAQISASYHSL
jgi:hypothetical protein